MSTASNPFQEGQIVTYVGGRTKYRVTSTPQSRMVAMVRLDGKGGDTVVVTNPRNVQPR